MTTAPPLVELLRAIDDPSRLRLLRLLSRMELAVGELAEVLEQSQPRISRHIRILTEAGLVEKRKEGSWVFLKTRMAGSDSPMLAAADRTGRRYWDEPLRATPGRRRVGGRAPGRGQSRIRQYRGISDVLTYY